LRRRGAWFATAGQVTSWFQMRRSVIFEVDTASPNGVRAKAMAVSRKQLPGLRLRLHKLRREPDAGGEVARQYVDVPLQDAIERYQAVNSWN
jgi:hypothetical protein